ncbi:RagB/SusD family nutrient uptake outer membrane protein [Antarcticibacterium flavum]|uniref:RagB/SusD family nutrient uptake outer membrane protein n=1 Tax=Antarcticibacterium flavum TaxID=2058175 RepID=A0A5B7X3S0_9FLAO|nr:MULTISPECIES: RagB/SusD family nutrient uptake outer membrane protein [Antarcticibacterium]MCM4161037.1 RagB/SusD family nutrient uptake outer membrane protein [Antarcticibacterium sp. W02-3]QCY69243.1 RagB/SusD family nutrient uptake outer membrane protein [Antarcticibacterium flavum]
MKRTFKYLLLFVLSIGTLTSCSEEDLEPTLAQSKSIETSINSLNDLEALLIGAMERMSTTAYYNRDVIILGEVFSDNATSNANSNRFVVEAQMDLNAQSAIASSLWSQIYGVIASANIIIGAEGIEGDEARINHIKGQAYAIRALAHFDLVKFYGQQHVNNGGLSASGVPYVTAFRDNDNLFPSRNTVQEVKDLAYADLERAQDLMSESLNDVSKEFITTYAAYAIEARIANYFGDHPRALNAAETVINSGNYTIASEGEFLSNFRSRGSANSIFEIANTPTDNAGINGLANIYQVGSYGDVVALPNLAAIYDEGDVRGVSPYDPTAGVQPSTVIGVSENGTLRNVGKYPRTAPFEDNVPVIRYEEIVLIYAEALMETGGADALTWLNRIPENRGGDTYDAATFENILLERRKELAFEGFRFHDLARAGMDIQSVDVIQLHNGVDYGAYNFALPIPTSEVDVNANIDQNTGY